MRNIYGRIPSRAVQPININQIAETPIVAYKSVEGEDVRHSSETLGHEEILTMMSDLGRLTGDIHSIDPGSFVYWLNNDNASLERIVQTINRDTIDRIGELDPDVASALNSVYDVISSIERVLLKNSPSVLIHGDWHPGNIVRKPDGSLCVIDYKSFTYGLPERDVASMLQQIHDQLIGRGQGITEDQIIEYQKDFLEAYPHKLDQDKLTFYKAWISWRNSLYHYAKHYLGGKYNSNGKNSLATARNYLKAFNTSPNID